MCHCEGMYLEITACLDLKVHLIAFNSSKLQTLGPFPHIESSTTDRILGFEQKAPTTNKRQGYRFSNTRRR